MTVMIAPWFIISVIFKTKLLHYNNDYFEKLLSQHNKKLVQWKFRDFVIIYEDKLKIKI